MTTPVVARFTFTKERAAEFSFDGRETVEMALDTLEELQEFTTEFRTALVDVVAISNGNVLSLSDFEELA